MIRGDGSHPPERLPALIDATIQDPNRFILATPRASTGSAFLERLVHRLGTIVQNRVLGMRVDDYSSGYRIYPAEALRRIPFQLNEDDRRFDAEILLQLRALGVSIAEERDTRSGAGGHDLLEDSQGLAGFRAAVGYRLHQAHLTRNGRYLVDHDIHYTLKHSETGSHHQVVDSIAPNSTMLDLGCSAGLLANPLLEKNVRVTGVDAGPGDNLAKELDAYHQRDLDLPLELPFERKFDYIVCADVNEHLKHRAQLLRGARRYLKPGGKLTISTPNIALWFYRLSLLVGRFEYGPRGVLDETHVHLYTGSTFRREVEAAGFQVLRTR